MSELWRLSAQRSLEFGAAAVAYDRYRPRYPDEVFKDIIKLGGLKPGANDRNRDPNQHRHGLSDQPWSEGGRYRHITDDVVHRSRKVRHQCRFIEGRFEDWPPHGEHRSDSGVQRMALGRTGQGSGSCVPAASPRGIVGPGLDRGAVVGRRRLRCSPGRGHGAPWPKSLDQCDAVARNVGASSARSESEGTSIIIFGPLPRELSHAGRNCLAMSDSSSLGGVGRLKR